MKTISLEVRMMILVVIAMATLGIVLTAGSVQWHDWPQLVLFFVLIAFAASVRISDPRGRSVTPTTVLTYLAMYVLNPPSVLLVVSAGRTIGYALSRGWVPWRSIFNGAQGGLSAAIGAYAFVRLGGRVVGPTSPETYLAVLMAPVLHQVTNNLFVAFGVSRWRKTPFASTWLLGVRTLFWPNLLSIPAAFILAVLYSGVHYAVTLIYLALLPFQWTALRLYLSRRELYAQVVDGLVVATDANFPLARGHARRVADLAVAIAREMRLSEGTVESIQFAALLHDIGMIGKDDLLERRPGTPEDAQDLRDHVRVGAEIARELPRKEISDIILHHHEHYDGTGYPLGLRGDSIPLGARVIAVAEAVDSMSRGIFPYSSPLAPDAVVARIAHEMGKSFDPDVVSAFLKLAQEGLVDFFGDGAGCNAPASGRLGESLAR